MNKICLIIHSLGIGGMERVMAQLANDFSQRKNVEVHIVLTGRKRNITYSISDSIIIHKPAFDFNDKRRQIDTLRTINFLRSEVQKINPETILSFGEMWNNLVLIALKGLNIPIFISDRSQPGKDLGRLHNYLRDKLYPQAAGYIAQTQKAKEICLSQGWNTNVKVIGNPIRDITNDLSVQRENIVLSVGRLIKTKHFDQLIKMFVEIGDPDWKLVIVGGDAQKQNLSIELQKQIKELGAENQVSLEGEQKDIDSYYLRSKIFAFTSSSEGFPNVVGEALSAGLPVVAYDCMAGPVDMINDGTNGFLVPLLDENKFKKKLQLLMDDEMMRQNMGGKTKESITNFAVENIADHYLGFITESQIDKIKVGT